MKNFKRKSTRFQRGQAMVEYVILIAVVALAALFVVANFSDRLREMIAGVTTSLGGNADKPDSSMDIIQNLDHTGVPDQQ